MSTSEKNQPVKAGELITNVAPEVGVQAIPACNNTDVSFHIDKLLQFPSSLEALKALKELPEVKVIAEMVEADKTVMASAERLHSSAGNSKDASGEEVEVTVLDVQTTRMLQGITSMLKVLDPTSYGVYRVLKYGVDGDEVPDLKRRISAYRFAVNRWLELGKKTPGF